MWQELYEQLKQQNFTIIAVAFDSRSGAARPWIDAASPTYTVLLDPNHYVAELYNMVNVNQAVWIDEDGVIVRPTESAGAYEAFRHMDRSTGKMPDEVAKVAADAGETYRNAVRDWAEKGARSEYVFTPEAARSRLSLRTAEIAQAHATFVLGQYLIAKGCDAEGAQLVARASELHPESWAIWRQGAELDDRGLAARADFWARVDELGDKKYYAAVDMRGMPA